MILIMLMAMQITRWCTSVILGGSLSPLSFCSAINIVLGAGERKSLGLFQEFPGTSEPPGWVGRSVACVCVARRRG